MIYLQYFLYIRASKVWEDRDMPSYLGPSAWQLAHLFALIVFNSLTLFLVGIMFLRSAYSMAINVTTIESWEIERHEQLLRRARVLGGYLDGPDGLRVRISHHEFPYDIGIWQNIRDGMGTWNILAWFWPFAASMKTEGLSFETNGFEEPGQTWPPPDPDRMPRLPRKQDGKDAFVYDEHQTAEAEIEAFKQRQAADLARRERANGPRRRKPFHHRFDLQTEQPVENEYLDDDDDADLSGEEGWQDSGGNRLRDYGVEEDIEFYDEDDMPIAELLRRREGRN
ncbi:hypothetical protein DV737_g4095, partial [Chaetothyriales sp. CBS 132003]